MFKKLFSLTAVAAVGCGCLVELAHAAGPPSQLYGKSVVLTFTEEKEQRPTGTETWRYVSVSVTQTWYISEKGKFFSRGVIASGGGVAVQGQSVNGQGSATAAVGANWQGRRASVIYGMGNSARRMVVDFDESFSSCSAQISFAKAASAGTALEYSAISRGMNEVKSAKITSPGCRIQSGNALAN